VVEMKAYRIKGMFLMKNVWQPFSKEIAAENEEDAKEQIFSIMGSRHRVKRKMMKIESITELKGDEIENSVVKYRVEGHHE